MGEYNGSSRDFSNIIESLRPKFKGSDYNILSKNCNSFADNLLQRMLGKELPGFVNRMAYIGSMFSCLFPDSLANNAPVDDVSETSRMINNNRNNSSSSISSFTGTGFKVGGSGSSSVTEDYSMEEMREKQRKAIANRLDK